MNADPTLNFDATEEDQDALEPFLRAASIPYQRRKLTRFSAEPSYATAITVAVAVIHALAPVLIAYIKQRRRRIAISKPDGTVFITENYSVEEVAKLLKESSEGFRLIQIEPPMDTPQA